MPAETPDRLVIYRLGSLGDTVVALPCLHRIAARYPAAERIVLTNFPVHAKSPPLEAVLSGSGLVHRYLAYPVGTRSLRELGRLALELRRLRAHTLVYLTPSRGVAAAWRDWLYFKLCGFRRIVGAPLSADLQRHRRDRDGLYERECERLARCLAALGPIALDDPASWDLGLTPAERACARAALEELGGQPMIALNMGGKDAAKDWGEARWRALFEALRERCGEHALLVVGGPEDRDRADALRALWRAPVLNLCGGLTPRASAAAMAGARFFVGHDSGPMHLAASVGLPCIGLFGDHNPPRIWHPLGPRHQLLHEPRGVQAIAVAAVFEAVVQMLAATAAP